MVEGAEGGGKKAVFLPAELYKRVEERVRISDFESVDEYVAFVLEEVLKAVSEEEGEAEEEEVSLSEEEEEEVKRRLRALGYLE